MGSLSSQPVAILGRGVSGCGVAALLQCCNWKYRFFDEAGDTSFLDEIASFGLVVYSPGFKQTHPWLERAREAGKKCLAEMDFASLFYRGELIAITGTNGKSTVADFLAFALCEGGVDARAVGNIGKALSAMLAERTPAVLVCEVSSFQAEVLEYFRCGALLWLNFSEDHLDRHVSMKAYFLAKWNLVSLLQKPSLFVGSSVKQWARHCGKTLPSFVSVVDSFPEIRESVFERGPQRENYAFVRAFWLSMGLSEEVLRKAAHDYKLSSHRFGHQIKVKGVTFWNDSKATNLGATLAALRSFSEPVIWLGGGRSKGQSLAPFVEALFPYVRRAYFIGESATALTALFHEKKGVAFEKKTLEEAVYAAFEESGGRGNIVFSPGFASFDLYKNYVDRGNSFEKVVLGLNNASAVVNMRPLYTNCNQ